MRKLNKFNMRLKELSVQARSVNKIVRFVADVDFRNGHAGLTELLQKDGVNVKSLDVGELVVMVNKARSAVKVFAAGNTIVYQKTYNHQQLHPGAIAMIPHYFNGSRIDLTSANTKAILKSYNMKQVREIPELE